MMNLIIFLVIYVFQFTHHNNIMNENSEFKTTKNNSNTNKYQFYSSNKFKNLNDAENKNLQTELIVSFCKTYSDDLKIACSACVKGYYLYNNDCIKTCPYNLVADNFSNSCKVKDINTSSIKAYSYSKCINKCGKEFEDCSCNIHCFKEGNCCSDIQFCEVIENSFDIEILKNCKHSFKGRCLQCLENLYLEEDQCVETCSSIYIPQENNKLCIKKPKIENCNLNCLNCLKNKYGKFVCLECNNNLFALDNQCLNICQINYKADKRTMRCVSVAGNSIDPFYWVLNMRTEPWI